MPPKKGKNRDKTGEGSKRTPEERPSTPNDNRDASTSDNQNTQVNDITFKNEKNVTKNMIAKFRKNQR